MTDFTSKIKEITNKLFIRNKNILLKIYILKLKENENILKTIFDK